MNSNYNSIFLIFNFIEIFPPSSFCIVENGLYRSAVIKERNLNFIEKLKLKTVIYLSPEIPSRNISNFYKEQHIKVV